ncbi:MAG: oxidoreductase [Trueperaceae bacterium]|jgi:xanthine dehydrogenase molybdenum-binding subunit|nr:oxidoreductase [Trueperaceae bacterium]|tara:strand:+ start:7638 stop:9890 length:2253 start_codon:yes stop_codon:yes gene_type:complete
MAVKEKKPPASDQTYKIIGSRPIRPDGVDKVTGKAIYAADVRVANRLYGAMVRSPHAHARIISIDTSKAEAIDGVKSVVTAADLPNVEDGLLWSSWKILARNKVLYDGHAIAAVAATSLAIAQEAADQIQIEYEVLPPVLDVLDAMADDPIIVLEDLRTTEMGAKLEGRTNVASHLQHSRGDINAGFAAADEVIEREFRTSTVHQGYIEPHSTVVLYNGDDHLTIWCSTQSAFGVRNQVAGLLDIPVSSVTVIPTEIGGGFGGKLDPYLEPVAALLSKKAGSRPVQMTMSRTEVLRGTGPTSGTYIRVKMGATKDGNLTAAEVYMAYEAGAFPGSPVGAGAVTILAPYLLDNLLINGYDVIVNKPKAAAYRAPGATVAAYAAESVVDELAEKLGVDPLDFRQQNATQEGDRRADGPVFARIGNKETLTAAAEHPHYTAPLEGRNRGRGVANGYWQNWGGKSSVSASINDDGSVNLVEGSTDIGGSRASIAMQLAETMDIPYESVRPQVVDTDSVGYNDSTGGSRVTFATGWAAYEVGLKLIDELTRRAATLLEKDPDDVIYEDGFFASNGNRVSFNELAGRLDETGSPVVASASVHPQGFGGAFGTHIVDVEVDTETGKVEILRYTAVQDVGKAIHPSYVEGQMHGGAAQGVGWALNEEYVYDDDGRLLNASFLDYRTPTALDLPMLDTVLVEVANPGHPYGVRGVGEVPIVPPVAAIANAIYDAIGIRMRSLPMSPGKILKAIWDKEGN